MQARARSTSPVLRRHCRVSPQRRVIGSRAFPLRPVYARGRTPDDLGAAAHPARGSPEGGTRIPSGFSRASSRGTQREGPDRSSLRRSRFGPVRGLGPTSSRPKAGDGRANRRRTASPLRGDALLRIGDAACATARHQSPSGPLRSSPGGCLSAMQRGSEQVSFRRVTRRLPCFRFPPKWVPSARHAAGAR